jgi:hypothetical protein
MLERLAARGIATDAAISDDFAAVRAHPKWKGVSIAPAALPAEPATPSVIEPKKPAAVEAPPVSPPVAKPPAPEPAKAPPVKTPPTPPAPERAASPAPLSFTTLLTPTALAYDAVSKRYLIADRRARRIAVIDERTGQVATLAGELARLGDVHGMAIDPRQGDLWVVTESDEGMSLSRLQLISGRQLGAARVTGATARIVALAFVRGTGLLAADERGDILKLSTAGQAEKIASLEYVPSALAADGDGVLYIAAGGSRVARYRVTPFRRLGVLDLEALPAGLPFTVVGGVIHAVMPAGAAYEIRVLEK